MNKRGNTFMLGLMFAFMLFIAAVVMVEPIKDVTNIARTGLDCANTSLSTGEEMSCIVTGSFLPVFLLTGIGLALAAIGLRRVREDS